MKIKQLIEENKLEEIKAKLEAVDNKEKAADIINNGESQEFNALHLACQQNKLEILKIFISFGGNVNQPSGCNWREGEKTPLHLAAENGNAAIIAFLLEHGATVDAQTYASQEKGGNTPLHFAVKKQSAESVELLLNHNASIKIKNAEGKTASDLAKAELRKYQKSQAFFTNDTNSLENALNILQLLSPKKPVAENSPKCPSCTLI